MHATRGEGGRLKVSGTMDLGASDALRSILAESFDQDHPVEIDLSEVAECDTAAMQLLHAARKTAEQSGRAFRVVAFSDAVAETGSRLGLPVADLTFEVGLST